MKRFALILVCLMVGCAVENDYVLPDEFKFPSKQSRSQSGWYVSEIDGCEYVRLGHGLAHKGNCKYCAERERAKKK